MKSALRIPIVILIVLVILAVLGLLYFGTKVNDSSRSVTQVAEYTAIVQDTEIKISQFLAGKASLAEIRGQFSRLAIIPSLLRNELQQSQIREIREQVEEVSSIREGSKTVIKDMIRLTDESVVKAERYMPYIRDQLLKNRSALSDLEIQTIVGASTHIKTNFRIQSLFLRTVSDSSLAPKLRDFVVASVENVEVSYQALIGTPFEGNTKQALDISYEIQSLVTTYLEQIEQVQLLTANIDRNLTGMRTTLSNARKDAISDTSVNIGNIVFILIGGLVGAVLLIVLLGMANRASAEESAG